ncbi:hypothetical protein [Desulfosediminicola flagellatus]|uniref:hypothetical protein n=1 Tax=Desulfosediminicola flagellatus TaxID=2569541 RepID=UPI001C3C36CA|nr:hypothetical protein [Desulfosediminicola flagellatus]
MIDHHYLYYSLGKTEIERQTVYLNMFRYELETGEVDKIRKATNGNLTLGNERSIKEIGDVLGRQVSAGKAGRPRKQRDEV